MTKYKYPLIERHREQVSRELYKNSWPTIVIAELLNTTIEQIETYLGNDRRVYKEIDHAITSTTA